MPKSAQPAAKAAPAEIWSVQDKDHAQGAIAAFAKAHGAKGSVAVPKTADE
jgi:putative transposase